MVSTWEVRSQIRERAEAVKDVAGASAEVDAIHARQSSSVLQHIPVVPTPLHLLGATRRLYTYDPF